MDSFSPSDNPPPSRWTDRFDRQVALHPHRTAVVCGADSLSYGELGLRANRIANLLRARGVGRGQFVGLGLHRSLDLPGALVGILKSGAAYVPLDPGYPAARIAQMIASAKLETVVTHSRLEAHFPGVRTVCVDAAEAAAASSAAPAHEPAPDDLLYAIFTSGSTGVPKAASVYQKGFGNLLHWYSIELKLGPTDKTLVISSPSFDLTQKNFFAPLATGGTLVLDDCQTYDISRTTALIRDHGVTLVNCTPSAFYPLVEAAAGGDYAALSSLRFAVLGGEPISIPRLRAWLEHRSCRAEVINTYGPTECTDICAFHRLHRGNLDEFPFVPLGREIPGTQVTIRGADLELLPDGETGELCISGAGLGGGYLNDPERTAAAFAGSLYRSGDLARRLPQGVLEFRGRADHQVKVNGHRIELGEIETALQRHEGVREAIVTGTENRLVAHVQGTASATALRGHLTALLPGYMIPGEFREIATFPLTPNGKIDRLALAAAAAIREETTAGGTSLEAKVVALWSEILGRPVGDSTANFFDLGGNSIHLAVVHVRLIELTGRKFPITSLFALPTARSIAEFLAADPAAAGTQAAHQRARQAQAGFSRFRPASAR